MQVRYIVERGAQGWGVYEGEELLSSARTRDAALEIARLLALAAKAAGGDARLLVESSVPDFGLGE